MLFSLSSQFPGYLDARTTLDAVKTVVFPLGSVLSQRLLLPCVLASCKFAKSAAGSNTIKQPLQQPS